MTTRVYSRLPASVGNIRRGIRSNSSCHGSAGLVNIKLSNGEYLVAGKKVAAFSNDEEIAVGLGDVVPFLLESTLIERRAIHTKAANFQVHIEVADRLVTGQNPASASGVGEKIVELIRSRS